MINNNLSASVLDEDHYYKTPGGLDTLLNTVPIHAHRGPQQAPLSANDAQAAIYQKTLSAGINHNAWFTVKTCKILR